MMSGHRLLPTPLYHASSPRGSEESRGPYTPGTEGDLVQHSCLLDPRQLHGREKQARGPEGRQGIPKPTAAAGIHAPTPL